MPAKKPSTLNSRNTSKEIRAERESAEGAMTPKTELTLKPPILLNGHGIAIATWKRAIKLWREVDGIIATAFDENLIANYCLLNEELIWMRKKRDSVEEKTVALDNQIKALAKKRLAVDEYKLQDRLYGRYAAMEALVKGLDARIDGKLKLMVVFEQSLYLTPRARAGVAPPTKPLEEHESDLEKLLNEY